MTWSTSTFANKRIEISILIHQNIINSKNICYQTLNILNSKLTPLVFYYQNRYYWYSGWKILNHIHNFRYHIISLECNWVVSIRFTFFNSKKVLRLSLLLTSIVLEQWFCFYKAVSFYWRLVVIQIYDIGNFKSL